MAAARRLLGDGSRDRRLQEQLRRQGQQLRLPRELPLARDDAVRADRQPDHAALRHPPGRSAAPARSAASCPASSNAEVPFQLSQRADFFEEEVGLETTLKRPIVNTRDEPHCDAAEVPAAARDRRRRQHERGRHLPQGRHDGDRAGDDRGRRARHGPRCWPTRCRRSARSATTRRLTAHDRCCASGRRATALEMQWALLERARKYERSHGLEQRRRGRSAPTCSTRWEAVLDRPRERSRLASPDGSTGWPSSGSSTAYADAPRAASPATPEAEGARPAVPRPASRQVLGRRASGWRRIVDDRRTSSGR